eukprot:scaffold4556_cov114-Isochrysis_galbana.AAC.15
MPIPALSSVAAMNGSSLHGSSITSLSTRMPLAPLATSACLYVKSWPMPFCTSSRHGGTPPFASYNT